RDGKGDVLRELSDACREYGIKFGVYVSPWDRNHPTYFTPEYNTVFKNMLEEVLTNYGEVYYVFFDGAFSVGPDGKRQEYDWDGFVEVVRRCQPNAVIFSDGGPDVRWIGNERGYAAETNWCTVNRDAFYPGIPGVNDQLLTGHEDGDTWLPAEVNTSIRPGWFYHKEEDDRVKPLSRLIDNWYHSVGMNGCFLLNLPPDTRGLIHENDVARLIELKHYLEEAFVNFLAGKSQNIKISASGTRGKDYAPGYAVDGDPETYWSAKDGVLTASLDLDLGQPVEMNAVLLQEHIRLGQRVKSFTIEARIGDGWTEVARGTTIGNRRILPFDTITTDRLRITFEAKACPLISNLEVYRTPDL
ncbi:MAG: alpha-L-fucosidase, partial [Candidatus Aminicenantes bacterium]|nr:alpha-L-fucosidase [Candidatus Aminicenantes bacterium]